MQASSSPILRIRIRSIEILTWSTKRQESRGKRIFQEWSPGTADPKASVTRPSYVICEKQTNNKHVKTPEFQFLTMKVISRFVRDLPSLKHIK